MKDKFIVWLKNIVILGLFLMMPLIIMGCGESSDENETASNASTTEATTQMEISAAQEETDENNTQTELSEEEVSYVGKWKLVYMEDLVEPVGLISAENDPDQFWTFDSDGTAVHTYFDGEDSSDQYTWYEKNDGIKADGEWFEYEFTVTEDNLLKCQDETMLLYFEKIE